MDGRSFNTAASTHIHLNKASGNLAPDHTLAQFYTVGCPMDIKLFIRILFFLCRKYRIHNSAGNRIQSVHFWVQFLKRDVITIRYSDLLFLQPFLNIIKIEHCINITRMPGIGCFLFLCNTWTDKYNFSIRSIFFPKNHPMSHHR